MRATTIVFSTLCVALCAGQAIAQPSAKKWQKQFHWKSPDQHFRFFMGHSGRLGAQLLEVSEGVRRALGAPADHGVLINEVEPDSAAAKAGLRAGDVLLSVGGDRVESAMNIWAAIEGAKKGDSLALVVVRNGKRRKLQVVVEDDPLRFDSSFDVFGGFGNIGPPGLQQRSDDELEKKLENMQKKLDELEKKLEKVR